MRCTAACFNKPWNPFEHLICSESIILKCNDGVDDQQNISYVGGDGNGAKILFLLKETNLIFRRGIDSFIFQSGD